MWKCSGSTHAELVARLCEAGLIGDERLRAAFDATDRAYYVPPAGTATQTKTYPVSPYGDAPQALGVGKATISAPHVHARALSTLFADRVVVGARVLDVGCGSGYLVACMARLVGPGGLVCGVDCVPDLIALSRANLSRDGLGGDANGAEIILRHGDGWEGAASLGPFDAIHVGAAATHVPGALSDQLKPGGCMVVPVGSFRTQALVQVDKLQDGTLRETELPCKVRFVPLLVQDTEASSSENSRVFEDFQAAARRMA